MANGEKVEAVADFLFLSSKITADEMKKMKKMTAAMKLKDACLWKESYDKPRQHIKKQRHHFANKGPYNQSYGFSSSHVGGGP